VHDYDYPKVLGSHIYLTLSAAKEMAVLGQNNHFFSSAQRQIDTLYEQSSQNTYFHITKTFVTQKDMRFFI